MEVALRVVLDVSPRLAALMERLAGALEGLGGAVGVAGAEGAAGGSSPAAAPEAAAAGLPRQSAPAAAEPGAAAEEGAAPEGAARPKRVMGRLWRTAEREALLRELWPTDLLSRQIIARMAALPGPEMPRGDAAFYGWASELNLPSPRPGRRELRWVGLRRSAWRTEERAALLREQWPAGVETREIVARMNALHGEAVVEDRIAPWAAELGVKRPTGFASAVARKEMARRNALIAAGSGVLAAQETAAATKAAAPAGPAGAGGVSQPPPPPQQPQAAPVRRMAPALPAPRNGKVYADFGAIKAWAAYVGIAYNGANIDAVNRRRGLMQLPPVVQDETGGEVAA